MKVSGTMVPVKPSLRRTAGRVRSKLVCMLLYAITDRQTAAAAAFDEQSRQVRLVELARCWAAGGVDLVQVREKDLEPEAMISLTRAVVAAVRDAAPGLPARVLLNISTVEQLWLADAAGVDGVHLAGSFPCHAWSEARAAIGLLSVACHGQEDIAAAREAGADLAVFAPVFEKPLAAGSGMPRLAGRGVAMLSEACRVAGEMPVIALGGVTPENAAACMAAGAAGVAGIRLFMDTAENAAWRRLRE